MTKRPPLPLSPEYVKRRTDAIYAKINKLHAEMRKIQSRCGHDWKHLPDPSGNNDSEYQCRGCGAYK